MEEQEKANGEEDKREIRGGVEEQNWQALPQKENRRRSG